MAQIKDDVQRLMGPEKAAIFMLALGNEQSSKLFEMMDDEEIRELSQIMSGLGSVNAHTIEQLFVDFADQISGAGSLVGSYDSTERLLYSSLPQERVEQIMEEIRGPAGRTMWDKLDNVDEAVLANYFKNEYPQTVAVVMTKLRAEHAARVIAALPENFAMEVIMRMLRMESVQKEVLDNVEQTLRKEFMANLARSTRRDSHELMADIFNNLDRNAENRFMTGIEERNRESAERIKALMFTFDDLARIDSGGIQTILREIEKDKLALALKGASNELKELFLENLSKRAAKMMVEDMEAMGAVRLKDVDEAQSIIVSAAKALADAGDINIFTGSEDDELVY
ncbi:MAG: flagellar motor switch protein FliG [Proteobacteria bacterium]|nr:flagellar motor switch protein FliG [Pseudomonadota bacterium]